ncbi:hypothetical protein Taro_037697 [Colocasia esculenta]|uniref:Retrotransposon gag domain-containing protein n=1 Tax=Colocasia esculenta TaxID=4460 RepID=A0A843W1A3_COLES|nr:hypothetical protein [Colocasia esculenta]
MVHPPLPAVDYGVFMQGLAQAPALVPQEHGHGGPFIMERFKRMAPPSFKGESQPLLAMSLMREVEKIFHAISWCLLVAILQERADVWWAFMQRTRYEDGALEVSWAELTRPFRAKFIPEHVQDKTEQEFLSLTQGSMTVLECEAIQDIDGHLCAVKIHGRRQHRVLLTPVGGNPITAKFIRLWQAMVSVVLGLGIMNKGAR